MIQVRRAGEPVRQMRPVRYPGAPDAADQAWRHPDHQEMHGNTLAGLDLLAMVSIEAHVPWYRPERGRHA